MLGHTKSTDYPVTNGSTAAGGYDLICTKLNALTGDILFSTYFGGTDNQYALAIEVADGFVSIVGRTKFGGYPVTNGTSYGGDGSDYDLVYTTLNATTGAVVASTYLGGDSYDNFSGLKVVGNEAYLVGNTYSSDFPTTDGSTAKGAYDIFYARLNRSTAAVMDATLVGAAGNDESSEMKLIGDEIYISGYTNSSDFPTTDGTVVQVADVVILKLDLTGAVLYSTLFGGSGGDFFAPFEVVGTDVYLTGYTNSNDLPVTNGSVYGGGFKDGYYARIDMTTSTVTACSYIGGSDAEEGKSIKVVGNEVHVFSDTRSLDFPTTNGSTLVGSGSQAQDVFYTKFDATTGEVLFSTLLGGDRRESFSFAQVEGNDVYIMGTTSSATFPVTTNSTKSSTGTAMFYTRLNHCGTTTYTGSSAVTPTTQTVCKNGVIASIQMENTVVSGQTFPVIYRNGVAEQQPDFIPRKYQWQIADAAGGPWTDIVGATTKNLSPETNITSKYYRRTLSITCDGVTTNYQTGDVAEVLVSTDDAPTVDAGDLNDTCPGETITLGGSPTATAVGGATITSYEWTPNDTYTPNNTNANPSVSPTNSTLYTVRVTDSNGCQQIGQTSVRVSIADAGADVSYCAGQPVRIGTQQVTVPGATYSWSPTTDLDDPTLAQPLANPASATTYTLTLTIPLAGGGTCNTTDDVVVTPQAGPTTNGGAFAGDDVTVCMGGTATIGTPAETDFTYRWAPGFNLSSAYTAEPTFESSFTELPSSNPTIYYGTATINGCSFKDEVQAFVIQADAGEDYCGPRKLGVPDASPNLNETYSWTKISGPGNFIGATNIAQPNVGASTGGTTIYEVTVSLNGVSCTDQVEVTDCGNGGVVITVNAEQGCPSYDLNNGNVTLTATSSFPATYTWSPADGLSSTTGATVTLTDGMPHTYTVTATSTIDPSHSGTDTETVNNPGWSLPVFVAQDPTACPNTPVAIGQPDNAGYTYLWQGPGLSSTTDANPTATTYFSQDYPVEVTDLASGCMIVDTANVAIPGLPAKAAATSGEFCGPISGKPVGADAVSGVTYNWTSNPPGATFTPNNTVANPTVDVATTTTFNVTATNTASGCSVDDEVTITIKDLVVAPFNFTDATFCPSTAGAIALPAGPAGMTKYEWSPTASVVNPSSNGPAATSTNPRPQAATTYTLKVTNSVGCTGSAEITLTPSPSVPLAGGDRMICLSEGAISIGDAANPTGGGITYSWSPATDLSSATSPNPTFTPTAAGTTTYTLSKTESGCTTKDDIVITVNDFTIPVMESPTICAGDCVAIGTTPKIGATYLWTPSTGLSNATHGNPTACPTTTTIYTLNAVDANGCSAPSQTVKVTVLMDGTPEINLDNTVAYIGTSFKLNPRVNPTAGTYSYVWTPNNGTLSNVNIAKPTVTLAQEGTLTYNLTVTNTMTGCSSTADVEVEVLLPIDSDEDGVPNNEDSDDDNDGIPDNDEMTCDGGVNINLTENLTAGPTTTPVFHSMDTWLAEYGIRVRHVNVSTLAYVSTTFGVINTPSWTGEGDPDNKMVFGYNIGGSATGVSIAHFAADGVTKQTTQNFSIWSDPTPATTVRVVAKDVDGNTILDRIDPDGTKHVVTTDDTGGVPIHELIFANASSAIDLISVVSSCIDIDTDNDGVVNRLDLDADNDGIPDNIEAQSTAAYTTPSGIDLDLDGLDDAYDATCDLADANTSGNNTDECATANFTAGTAIVLQNSDDDATPDVLDLDSDNDNIFDIVEAGNGALDTDADGKTNGTVGNNGLDNTLETTDDWTDVNGNLNDPTTLPNTQATNTPEVDYRELADADNDGIADAIDLDDDNDGIPDSEECPNLGTNDSFEEPDVQNYSGFNPSLDADNDGEIDFVDGLTTLNNWTVISGKVDLLKDYNNASDGVQSIDLYGNSHGVIEQTFTVPAAGTAYNFSVDYSSLDVSVRAEVSVDGTTVTTLANANPTVTNGGGGGQRTHTVGWNTYNYSGVSTGTAVTIRFTSTVFVNGDTRTGILLDNFFFLSSHNLSSCDTDGDGIANNLDLDSDNDGIPDNVEAQSTAAYVTPSGIDLDSDGLDDAYDATCDLADANTSGDNTDECTAANFTAGTPIVIQNSDSDIIPDFLDLDSDNDNIFDIVETGNVALDTDTDGKTDGTVGDNGLDNTLETTDDWTDVNGNLDDPTTLPNTQNLSTAEVDYRQIPDADNDGIADATDLDDDNDGIPDSDECPNLTDNGSFEDPNIQEYSGPLTSSAGPDGEVDYVNGVTTLNGWNIISGSIDILRDYINASEGNQSIDLYGGDHAVIEQVINVPAAGTPYSFSVDYSSITDIERATVSVDGNIVNTFFNNTPSTDPGDGVGHTVYNVSWSTYTYTGVSTGTSVTIRFTNTVRFDNFDSGIFIDNFIFKPEACDTDNDGISNQLDLDSDNDGIADNIEAQPTATYVTPSGNDNDLDGLDDAYDATCDLADANISGDNTDECSTANFTAGSPIVLQNSDTDNIPDYLDLDSDNDNSFDIVESGNSALDTDNDGKTNGTVGLNGLDNSLETTDDWTDVNGNLNDPTTLPNMQTPSTPEVDYREIDADDSDNDGIPNIVDLDDDNDGILDIDEGCTSLATGEFGGTFGTTLSPRNLTTPPGGGYTFATFNSAAGQYAVISGGTTPHWHANAGLWSFNGHTTGQPEDAYLAVNGSTSVGTFFKEDLALTGGTSYNYLIWHAAAYDQSANANNGYALKIVITRISDGAVLAEASTGPQYQPVWKPLDIAFTPATTENYRISLVNTSTQSGGNDFTIDDITFTVTDCGQDTDGDGISDNLDLDSDNDGIPDNIEFQSTDNYVAPSGNDVDMDGIDDAYDGTCSLLDVGGAAGNADECAAANFVAGNFIIPQDTDLDGAIDAVDLDSDGDNIFDIVESGNGTLDTDNDGRTNGTVGNNGLDNTLETTDGWTDVNGNLDDPTTLPNTQNLNTAEVDYRQIPDADNDGIADETDKDDDNDGIPDTEECPNLSANGSFENPNIQEYSGPLTSSAGPDGEVDYVTGFTTFSGWNLVSGSIDLLRDFCNASDDEQAIDLHGNSAGVMEQTFTVPAAGTAYNFNIDYSSIDVNARAIVNVDGVDIETLVNANPATNNGDGVGQRSFTVGWNTYTYSGISAGTSVTIRFTNTVAPSGGVGIILDNFSFNYTDCDTDGDGISNHLDLDSDNDGIADNIEAQPTATYAAPSGNDLDMDGLDDAYDATCDLADANTSGDNTDECTAANFTAGTPIVLQNSDTDADPDYLDLDSDEDGIFDIVETGNGALDTDNDGKTDGTVGINGLDNSLETTDDWTDINGNLLATNDPAADLPNNQNTQSAEVDYRDATLAPEITNNSSDPTNTAMYLENGINLVVDFDATDGNGDEEGTGANDQLDWSITGGADAAIFTINDDGELTFIASPDYDADGKTNGTIGANGLDNTLETADDWTDANGNLDDPTTLPNIQNTNTPEVDYRQIADADNDGIADAIDLDDDNDGNLDINECQTSDFYWSNPPSVSGSTATGTINGIGYTYNSSQPIGTSPSVFGHSNFPSSYALPNTTCIKNVSVTNNTLTFDSPMTNPVLVFASIGNSSNTSVGINFGEPIEVLFSQGVVVNSATKITGTEGYAVVRMNGTFSSVTFNYTVAESFANFLFGADFYTYCDTDMDGITNNLDLDSDNDGIFDIVETGNSALDTDADGVSNGTMGANGLDNSLETTDDWTDVNGNLDDPTTLPNTQNENTAEVDYRQSADADNDGIADADDKDDDNDGIPDLNECPVIDFDFVASGATNTATSTGGPNILTVSADNGMQFSNSSDQIVVRVGSGPTTGQFTFNFSQPIKNLRLRVSDYDLAVGSGALNEFMDDFNIFPTSVEGTLEIDGPAVKPTIPDSEGFVIWENLPANTTTISFRHNRASNSLGVFFEFLIVGTDSDGDGIPNCEDLDADNDGIADNIEGQPTATYTMPSGTDADMDGLDDVYDDTCDLADANTSGDNTDECTAANFTAGTPIVLQNSDTDNLPDYLDLDSDEDGIFDIVESGNGALDTDADGKTNGTTGVNGLDNTLETADDWTDINGTLLATNDPAADLPNNQNAQSVEVDYRDATIAPEITNNNSDPTNTATFLENGTGTVLDFAATDANGDLEGTGANDQLDWSITGGPDAAIFTINDDGELTFIASPDYETPTDADTNNEYIVEVTVADPQGNTDVQTLTVTVTDEDEDMDGFTGVDDPDDADPCVPSNAASPCCEAAAPTISKD